MKKQPEESLGIAFKKILNSHGYPFQNSIVKAIARIPTTAVWTPWVPEFPVEVQGQPTRIDLVLTDRLGDKYFVCECKRANPSISNWCFAKAFFTTDRPLSFRSFMETLLDRGDGVIVSHVKELLPSDRIYQIALEVKSVEKGDGGGRGHGQIEEAATQVCRGLNGYIDFFYKRRDALWKGKNQIAFLPVVLTTAKLWATDQDLSVASPETGELDIPSVHMIPMKWLWYQYPQSPGLKHMAPPGNVSTDLRDIMFYEFVRPIAFVTPDGLQDFLSSTMWSF